MKNAVCATIFPYWYFDDSSSPPVRTFRLPSPDRPIDFSIPPTFVDAADKVLKEVPFDFVLLRPSLQVCAKPAASRPEGAITDYAILKKFYALFEEGTIEPICDDAADPESLARRIADRLNQGRFRLV